MSEDDKELARSLSQQYDKPVPNYKDDRINAIHERVKKAKENKLLNPQAFYHYDIEFLLGQVGSNPVK